MSSRDQVRKEIEETRELLGTKVDSLVVRTRHELDWRGRLRRNLPKVAAAAVAAGVVVAGVLVVRARVLPSKEERARLALTDPEDLRDLAEQIRALREDLDERVARDDSFVMRSASRYLTAAGVASGTLVTQYLMRRFTPDMASEVEGVDPAETARKAAAVS